jgi:hypothetical protein
MRDKSHHVTHKYMIAVRMSREGYPRKAIAEHMGSTAAQINCLLGYAKRLGVSVEPDLGVMIAKNLPPPIIVWLKKQVPEGGAVIDVVRAILTDVYHDDKEKLK